MSRGLTRGPRSAPRLRRCTFESLHPPLTHWYTSPLHHPANAHRLNPRGSPPPPRPCPPPPPPAPPPPPPQPAGRALSPSRAQQRRRRPPPPAPAAAGAPHSAELPPPAAAPVAAAGGRSPSRVSPIGSPRIRRISTRTFPGTSCSTRRARERATTTQKGNASSHQPERTSSQRRRYALTSHVAKLNPQRTLSNERVRSSEPSGRREALRRKSSRLLRARRST